MREHATDQHRGPLLFEHKQRVSSWVLLPPRLVYGSALCNLNECTISGRQTELHKQTDQPHKMGGIVCLMTMNGRNEEERNGDHSASLVIMETQIKTRMRSCCLPEEDLKLRPDYSEGAQTDHHQAFPVVFVG